MRNAVRLTCQIISLVLFLVVTCAPNIKGQPGKKFELSCPLPFEAIKKKALKIDKTCGITGKNTKPSAQTEQNKAKNNFCASGAPVSLNFDDFSQLQQRVEEVHMPFGKIKAGNRVIDNLPKDRTPLQNILKLASGAMIGEGNVVVVEGFVISARHSNTKFSVFHGVPGGGESVNCNSGEIDRNDIHIDLAETLADIGEHCKGITAEISPHFRPASWDRFDTDGNTKKAAKGIKELKNARVRITGQLFFDASHAPCKDGQPATPARRSSWEVHPVYAIEIFDPVSGQFMPLDQWAKDK